MLEDYRRKRNFQKTAEPSGESSKHRHGARQFVVQKHATSRLHYDFRLEFDGILLSWAVPKGPSCDPAQKRLAVHVEDHPYAYRDFEGVIAKGQYGAGEVIVWDRGTYTPLVDGQPLPHKQAEEIAIRQGLEKGKLTFVLDGEKLHGEWALVKLRNTEKEWLLVKASDKFANNSLDVTDQEESVKSGRTLADLAEAKGSVRKSAPTRAAGSTSSAARAAESKATKAKTAAEKLPGRQTKPARQPRTGQASHAQPNKNFPTKLKPMLAGLAPAPFTKEGWVFEPKLDGYRAMTYLQANAVVLSSRNGLRLNGRFPEIEKDLRKIKHDVVLDGEIIALDENGRPSFQHLQQIAKLRNLPNKDSRDRAKTVRQAGQCQYYVFDILLCDGQDLTRKPLKERKAILRKVLKTTPRIKLVDFLNCDGRTAYKTCIDHGMEGVVAKLEDSIYEPGRRSKSWLKIKGTRSSEYVICGYTEGSGFRAKTFGALVLAQQRGKELRYAGLVGTGFTESLQKDLLHLFAPLVTHKKPLVDKIPRTSRITWIKPTLVAEIKYAEVTQDGSLRAPVFLRMREDMDRQGTAKTPPIEGTHTHTHTRTEQQKMNKNDHLITALTENQSNSLTLAVDGHDISFSNLNKVLWPGAKNSKPITKRDYAVYLCQAARYMLPHMQHRPLTLIRYPNGVLGTKFFQKHWNDDAPPFVNFVTHYSEHDNTDKDFLLADNLSTLLWLAQLAATELHIVHTRTDKDLDGKSLSTDFAGSIENIEGSLLNYPDFVVFDLDPYQYARNQSMKDEPLLNATGFGKTCSVALWLKQLLDDVGLTAFVKTSGKSGLHIYVPIERNIDYDSVREIAGTFGKYLMQDHRDDITMEWSIVKRTGKVFFDHNMNGRGKTLPCAYSPRNAIEGTVSTPLTWDEVGAAYPTDFTIWTIPERLRKKGDPWTDILEHKTDLKSRLKHASTLRAS